MKAPSIQIQDDTRKLFAYFLMAGKNMSLYPEGHSFCLNSIHQFHSKLDAYIRQYGDVKIELEKDRAVCNGEDVQSGFFEEGTLLFIIFRDGVRWFEFSAGISEEEIREFLSIIMRYRIVTEESDGDVVTAFWEAQFAHIAYEAAALPSASGTGPQGISRFTSQKNGKPVSETGMGSDVVQTKQAGPVDAAIVPEDLTLSPQDQELLNQMILREEKMDASVHLYMLLDSLLLYPDEHSVRLVLDVLAEEFSNFLTGGDYQACLVIAEGVGRIAESGRLKQPWAETLLMAFIAKISDAEHLEPLEELWLTIKIQDVEILERILRRLHPKSINTLAMLLLVHKPPQIQKVLEDAVIAFVRRDKTCLEPVLHHSDERIISRLIPILTGLEESLSLDYLIRLARHPAVAVRRQVVRFMIGRPHAQLAEIFEYIHDPDETVRRLILRQLGQRRNETAETLLLGYLKSHRFTAAQSDYALECFRTLGKCGSLRSVPFLREMLLQRKWAVDFRKSPYRFGAMLALAALKIPEARQVIDEARRSLHPGLRRLAREVDQEWGPDHRGDRQP